MRRSGPTRTVRLLLLTLLSGVGLAVSATAATVYVAGDGQRLAASRPHRVAGVVGGIDDGIDRVAARASGTLRQLVDSLLRADGSVAGDGARDDVREDGRATQDMIALLYHGGGAAGLVAVEALDPSRADALTVYRAWARQSPMSPFWAFRKNFPDVPTAAALPALQVRSLVSLVDANTEEADSALARGDAQGALVHAFENLAAARHLLWQPLTMDAAVGRALMEQSAMLLARAALQADAPFLHTRAQEVQQLAHAAHGAFLGAQGEAAPAVADPEHPAWLALAGDQRAFPASRLATLDLVVRGSCVSTRDMLFGASAARHDAIDRLIDAMRDMPRANELRPLYHRELDLFDRGEVVAATAANVGYGQRETDNSLVESVLRRLVPSPVTGRVTYCRARQRSAVRESDREIP